MAEKTGSKKYRVLPHIVAKYPVLITQIDGKRVSLIGEVKYHKDGDLQNPPIDATVPEATQAQLKLLFGQGHPFIEEVEE